MEVYVKIPRLWKESAGGKDVISAQGRTVREVLQWLAETYPQLKDIILNREGEVRNFIIHVNDKDMRCIQDLETPLDASDQLSVVLSITPLFAGG
jgi:molybdopterin converting factor small subunit